MKMKEIEVSPFVKTRNNNWGGTLPYTIAFVYHPDGNCIVKGMSNTVEDYIYNNFPRCIYYVTYWSNGECRGFWHSTLSLYIDQRKMPNGKIRFTVDMLTKDGFKKDILSFRRVPKKWLDIYNQAIPRKRYY